MLLRSRRVVIDGAVQPAAIQIEDGVITAILPFESVDAPVTEAAILPGLVDTHVHINEPGRAHWEGFKTATRAAAAGGVTTLIEMPLNSIPATTTVAAYQQKIAAAEGKLHVDTGFWGGVVPGNTAELEPLWRAGVFGFKCFLVPSGVDEFSHVGLEDLREAMPLLARLGAWTPGIAFSKFLQCCHSERWAREMTLARPFPSWNGVEETAASIWKRSTREEILEAFAAHPKIGDHKGAGEQSQVRTAPEVTLEELARLNREYESRFGYIYIVCATGKSAGEMLALLRQRLMNDPAEEFAMAAEEQRLITQLRLRRL